MQILISSINPDAFYDTAEAAKLLKKSYSWFARHRWKKTGPRCNASVIPVLYRGSDLLAYLEHGRGATQSAA